MTHQRPFATSAVTEPSAPAPNVEVVLGIDHVNVAARDPVQLAGALQKVLGLTAAWSHDTPFVTIGLAAGPAVTVAVDRSAGEVPFLVPGATSRFAAIAFAPIPTKQALAALDRRGIPHNPPSALPDWTTTFLPGLLNDSDMAFLCEYTTRADFQALQACIVDEYLAERARTPGVAELVEVVLHATPEAPTLWQHLLGPPTQPGQWSFATGPSLILEPGPVNRIDRLVFAVDQYDTAVPGLRSAGVPFSEDAGSLTFDPAVFDGLRIALTPGQR